jgi:hypothetical protein
VTRHNWKNCNHSDDDNRRRAEQKGVSPTALRAISDDLDVLIKNALAVEHLNDSRAVQTVALRRFYRKLDQTRAFDADTAAGQVMRCFAGALALAGAAFSLKAAIDDPNGLSVAKAGVDAVASRTPSSAAREADGSSPCGPAPKLARPNSSHWLPQWSKV